MAAEKMLLRGMRPPTPKQNQLLAALPAAAYERLLPDLDLVRLPLGWTVYESGVEQANVYFPATCILSLVYVLAKGSSAQIAVVGNEGAVGVAFFMGGDTTPSRAVVQSAGYGFRLSASLLRRQCDRGGALQSLLLRHSQALITQMSQTALCNRHHSVEQQLCRWLLLSLDRLASNELNVTPEFIAAMLGGGRESVTEAAGNLQAAGLIHYSRGTLTLLDRPTLEGRVCGCYDVVKSEYERQFSSDIALPAG